VPGAGGRLSGKVFSRPEMYHGGVEGGKKPVKEKYRFLKREKREWR